jgi:glycosyltransferase involved in cell wall biosynthesis
VEAASRLKTILFITDVLLEMAGAERNLVYLVRNLDKDKFRSVVCCLKSGSLAVLMRKEGYEVIDLAMKRLYTPSGLKRIAFLMGIVRREKVKAIISYHWTSDILGFIVAKFCRIPIISSRRDMGYSLKGRSRLAYKIVGRFFDSIIAVSGAVKREICKRDLIPKEKVFVVYNGVNLKAWRNDQDAWNKRAELGIRDDTRIVGTVAGLRKIKGIKFFLRAAAAVVAEERNTKFLVIGPDQGEKGCTKADLERYAQDLGISSHVAVLGKRDDIAELLAIMDVFVNASLSEGLSNAILEAMAAAKPIIATNVGGTPEVIDHGKTGILVPPADAAALAMAIFSLLRDEGKARRMGIAAREKVRIAFSLEKMIKRNEDLYESVITARSKRCGASGRQINQGEVDRARETPQMDGL